MSDVGIRNASRYTQTPSKSSHNAKYKCQIVVGTGTEPVAVEVMTLAVDVYLQRQFIVKRILKDSRVKILLVKLPDHHCPSRERTSVF